jgi:hypothetical protein
VHLLPTGLGRKVARRLEQLQLHEMVPFNPLVGELPTQVYGQNIGSDDQRQRLKLWNHFKPYVGVKILTHWTDVPRPGIHSAVKRA